MSREQSPLIINGLWSNSPDQRRGYNTTQEQITNFLKEVFYLAQTYAAGKAV